jgi:hypothetical protein
VFKNLKAWQEFCMCTSRILGILLVNHPAASHHPLQALHPSGSYLLTAARNGKLSKWQLRSPISAGAVGGGSCSSPSGNNQADFSTAAADAGGPTGYEPLQLEASITKVVVSWPGLDGGSIDCMSFLTGRVGLCKVQRWGLILLCIVPSTEKAHLLQSPAL